MGAALVVVAPVVAAKTVAAKSCGSADVQAALNSAAAGDTVSIPAGTCTWTSVVSWTAPANVTVQGAGTSATGGGDKTVIVDSIARGGSDPGALSITTSATGTFRLTGITFRGSGSSGAFTDNGTLRVNGKSTQVRLDHLHFDQIRRQALTTYGVYGVVDHSLFDMVLGTLDNAARLNGVYTTFGDPEWAADTGFGGAAFMFVEDSTFNNGIINDCVVGGRQVFRYNTFNNTWSQTHPTGSQGRLRGCRAMEIYGNTFNGAACNPICFNVHYMSSGPLLIWGNAAGSGYQNFMSIHSMRKNSGTYSQSATPAGWGYCGTAFNGTGSAWDQNTDASSGYACLDQPGRGRSALLSGDFPNVKNSATGTIAWPSQALEPIYEWSNSWTAKSGGGGSFVTVYEPTVLAQNRDFYVHAAPFNGTAGTGVGSLSARPATCIAGTAYWATDTSHLYVCAAGNQWTAYYAPYTYPHPLTGSSSTAPPIPANVRLQ